MSVTETLYPTSNGYLAEWTVIDTTHWSAIDEAGTPNTSDFIHHPNAKTITSLKLDGNSFTYDSCKYVPWTSWKIKIYGKDSGDGMHPINLFIRYGGTNYLSTTINLTSSWAWHEYEWTSPPWSTDINWGVSPKDVEIGVKNAAFGTGDNWVAAMRMECVRPDHTPGTPITPDTPLVQTYNNKQKTPEEDGEYNPNDLVDWQPKFSCIHKDSDSDSVGVKIKVGTSVGGTDMWNSDAIYFSSAADYNERTALTAYDGSTLQDGKTYYWTIRIINEWCEDSNWLTGGTMKGVTDTGWWSNDYNKRFNVRPGTSHSGLGVGYTVDVEIDTGHAVKVSDKGIHNESTNPGGPGMVYYEGYYYISWIGFEDYRSDNLKAFIGKYKRSTGSLTTKMLLDMGQGYDTHFVPSLFVGKDNKLHVIINGHVSASRYTVTTGSHQAGSGIDISSWETITEPSCFTKSSYCIPALSSDGTVHVFYRSGPGSPTGSWTDSLCYARRKWNGSSYDAWSSMQYVIFYSDPADEYNPSIYHGGPAIDSNDRLHICITWWDHYGAAGNLGRAVSYMYSDIDANKWFTDWYEKESENSIGSTTSTAGSSNIQYADCSKVATCTNHNNPPISGPYVHAAVVVVDNNNNPYFSYCTYQTNTTLYAETPLYFCKWNSGTSSWSITNLYTESGIKLWKYRHASAPYYDDGNIYFYGFVKPSGETWFAGELYFWRYNISQASWSHGYISGNSGLGIGCLARLLDQTPGGNDGNALLYARGNEVWLLWDEVYDIMRKDGNDVRVVETNYNSGSPQRTELKRVTFNQFFAEDTRLAFALSTGISENAQAATDKMIQVYFGKHDASNPPDDTGYILRYLENFEGISSNSQLHANNGWSVDTPANVMIYSSDDSTNYTYAHTNKLWDGDRFCVFENGDAVATKDLNDAYPGLGTDITDRYIYFHVWDAGSDGKIYIELWNETNSKYVRFGLNGGTDKFCYKTTTGEWTDGTSYKANRHHTFKLRIRAAGVTGWVDGYAELTETNEITVFDKIKIGMTGRTTGDHIIDQVYIVDYVANDPEWTVSQDNSDVKYAVGTSRVGHTLQLVHEKTDRQAHKLIPEKEVAARLASTLTTEAEKTARLSAIILGDKVALARIAEKLILDAVATGRLSEIIQLEKELSARIAAGLILEATATGRISAIAQLEAEGLARIAHDAILEAAATGRLAEYLQLDKIVTARLAQILIADKEVAARLCQLVLFEAEESGRLAEFVQLEAEIGTRLAAFLQLEKVDTARISEIVQLEAETSARLMNALILDVETTDRIAQILIADKESVARIMHTLIGDKEVEERLTHIAVLEIVKTSRIAETLLLDKNYFARLMHYLEMEATATPRFAHLVHFVEWHTERIAQILQLEAESSARLAELLIPEAEATGRIAGLFLAEATATARAAHKALLEITETGRLAQILQFEGTVTSRVAHILVMSRTYTARLAHIIALEISSTDRLGHYLALQAEVTDRMAQRLNLTNMMTARLASLLLTDKETVNRLTHLLLFVLIPSAITFKNIFVRCAECRTIEIRSAEMRDVYMRGARADVQTIRQARIAKPFIRTARLEPVERDEAGEPIWIR